MTTTRQSALPPAWSTSSSSSGWWNRIAGASRSLLVLDYDGTLAPFTLNRMESLPYPGIAERISQLLTLSRTTVMLVTGRTWSEITTLYPTAQQVEVWASHGWEHSLPGGACRSFALSDEQKAALGGVLSDPLVASLPASSVERKPASVAIHWRALERDEQEQLRKRVLNRFERHFSAAGIELLPFEDGVELRAKGRTKGDAVQDVRSRFDAQVPVAYLGDDHTDEEAFAAMPPEDLALLVRPAPRATLADYWMPAPEGVVEFLDRWIESAGGNPEVASSANESKQQGDDEFVDPSPS